MRKAKLYEKTLWIKLAVKEFTLIFLKANLFSNYS